MLSVVNLIRSFLKRPTHAHFGRLITKSLDPKTYFWCVTMARRAERSGGSCWRAKSYRDSFAIREKLAQEPSSCPPAGRYRFFSIGGTGTTPARSDPQSEKEHQSWRKGGTSSVIERTRGLGRSTAGMAQFHRGPTCRRCKSTNDHFEKRFRKSRCNFYKRRNDNYIR
jgi:hypothetical protein